MSRRSETFLVNAEGKPIISPGDGSPVAEPAQMSETFLVDDYGRMIALGGNSGPCSCVPEGPALSTFATDLKAAYGFTEAAGKFLDITDNEHDLDTAGTPWTRQQPSKRLDAATAQGGYAYNTDADVAPAGVGARFTMAVWVNKPGTFGHPMGFAPDHTDDTVGFGLEGNGGDGLYLRRNNGNLAFSGNGAQISGGFQLLVLMRDETAMRVLINNTEYITYSGANWDDDLANMHLLFAKGGGGTMLAGTKYAGGLLYHEALSGAALTELFKLGRGTFIGDVAGLNPPAGDFLTPFAEQCIDYWGFQDAASPLLSSLTGGEKFVQDQGSGELYQQPGPIEFSYQFGAVGDNAIKTLFRPFVGVGLGDFSISGWVRPDVTGCNFWSITQHASNDSFSNAIWVSWDADKFALWGLTAAAQKVLSAADFPSGINYLITILREAGTMRLFVNKTEIGSTAALSSFDLRYANFYMGRIIGFDSPGLRVSNTVAYAAALNIGAITELHDNKPVPA